MSNVSLYIIKFRVNDLIDNTGKQFEIGSDICSFLGIDESSANKTVSVPLTFKAICENQLPYNNKNIELNLSLPSIKRGDRKAYTAEEKQHSKIKQFFLNDLQLSLKDKDSFSFAFLNDSGKIYLYVIPYFLIENFINYFKQQEINITDKTESPENIVNTHLQQIFYGAPGTGKSHSIKKQTEGNEVIRTTFHPDSDYASFVGTYKPTTTQVPKYVINGLQPTEVTDSNGKPVFEEKITYNFIPQAFLNAYISAWKKLAKTPDNETEEKVYLIIEEINRGNCAQIFGDLFQLLDRKEDGFSDYPIKADADMQKQLAKEFNGITIQNSILSNEISNKVLNGEILLLPRNLFIWATMNTSDQSLFPIDSAFKRRWDWTYVPIYNAEKQWKIQIGNNTYDWWKFLEKINEKIESLTNSEDKKLGYFFCKAPNNIISEDVFVGKVIFYLWNDVFKDYEFEDDVFKDEDGSKLIFNKFYIFDGTKTVIDERKVIKFLSNLKVENETPLEMDDNSTEENQQQEQTEEQVE